jgi:ABC-type sugar transport system ATPase subunit
MNLIDCSFTQRNGEYYLDSSSFTYKLSEPTAEIIRKGSTSSEVTLGVRPEDLTLHKIKDVAKTPDSIEGIVYALELLGSEVIVGVKVGSEIISVKLPAGVPLEINEKVLINSKKTHVFDKKTQTTLL